MPTYPPLSPALTGDVLAASRFLNNSTWVARRLQDITQLRYVGAKLLTGRTNTISGAVGYELVEGIFADAPPEIVAPGAEYKLTTTKTGPAGMARVAKYGHDRIITDEAVSRLAMNAVEKDLGKLANSVVSAIDQAVISVIASAVTATGTAAAKWTTGPDTILQDIMLAQAAITSLNLGYQPDTLLVDDTVWAYLTGSVKLAGLLQRETTVNPIYTGDLTRIAGLNLVHVPAGNLPGGVNTNAWVVDSRQLGFIATEDLGGGYTSAGDLVETKVYRKEDVDAWRIRVRANFAPVVTDPGAGYRIATVA